MAELTTQAGRSHKPGGRRSKKLSTLVDLTPMVDLGFLLITFFIVTTTWSLPHATNLNMPADGNSSTIGNNAVLTLVPLSDNKVFYYHGDFGQALKEGSFGITSYNMTGGIGDIIRAKQAAMDHSYKGGRKEMMLLLKPSPGSSYKNVVNLLDETLINQVKRYALVDLSAQEEQEITKRAAAKS